MKLDVFFSRHPVFTVQELDDYLGDVNKKTRTQLLNYHRRSGRILSVRRGLYAVVPLGMNPETTFPDPYLLASKMTTDGVLAYHTALEFYGKAYSVYSRFFYLSRRPSQLFRYRSMEFRGVFFPSALEEKGKELFEVKTLDRQGLEVKVTSLERTLVDVLDRPDYCGGWEEIWRSLEFIEYVRLDLVTEYVRLLGKSTTAAKVGFYLEQHKDELMVKQEYLDELKEMTPRQPHYLERRKRNGGQLAGNWNLVVPDEVINRSWEEVAYPQVSGSRSGRGLHAP
jgi:predicted transcriptional regulator of viral defense system